MRGRNIKRFSKWVRYHRAAFTLLLSMMVVFNAAHTLAAEVFSTPPEANSTQHNHAHSMQTSCCTTSSHDHANCCDGVGCACQAHCASLWLSSAFPELDKLSASAPTTLAESTPNSHIIPPPQYPPRA